MNDRPRHLHFPVNDNPLLLNLTSWDLKGKKPLRKNRRCSGRHVANCSIGGTWISSTSGAGWATGTNWNGGIIGGNPSSTASVLTAINVDLADRTIGNLVFTSTVSGLDGSLANNSLKLSSSTGFSAVTVTNAVQRTTIAKGFFPQNIWEKKGTGTLVISEKIVGTQRVVVSEGTLEYGGKDSIGGNPGSFVADQVTSNGGVLKLTGTFYDQANQGDTLGTSGGTINAAGSLVTLASNSKLITGAGALTKTGVGRRPLVEGD